MSSFKEIVTKTVIGKAKKTIKDKVQINPEQNPSTVLGCWVINHKFEGSNEQGKVKINGSYDVNVWYSYDNDHKTAVTTFNYSYNDIMNVPIKNNANITDRSEIIVRSLKQPTVSDVKINNNSFELSIEKELGVEVVGEAKIKVTTEDDFDDYEEVFDDNDIDKVLDEVNEEYLN